MSTRELELLNVARRARRYFEAVAAGRYVGDFEDLLIGQELGRVLAQYDDIEPVSDLDRQELAMSRKERS